MSEADRPLDAPRSVSAARHWVLVLLCLLAFVTYVLRTGFANVGTEVRTDLGLTSDRFADVMTAFLLAYAIFEIPWGALCDRLGARHLLAVVTLGWCLVTALTGLAALLPRGSVAGELSQAFLCLLGLRFLFGAFQAGVFPIISRVIGDWIPVHRRASAKGLVWTCSRAGGAVAGYLVLRDHWGLSLAALSLLGLVWCVAFWPWFRNRPEESHRVSPEELRVIAAGRAPAPSRPAALPWRALLGSRNVWCLCLMYCFAGFTASFYVTLLPDYLRSYRGLAQEDATWMAALPLACGIVGCAAGGFLSDRIGRRAGNRNVGRRLTAMTGFSIAGVAMLATIWVEDPRALGALLATSFFCFDLTMGPAWATCVDIGERHAGSLGGAMNMFGNLGAAAGSQVAGLGLGADSGDIVFIAFACSYWLAALCWLGIDATRALEGRTPPARGMSIGTRLR